jgi:thiosulfate/3-mercaptopyruvate sulfurtransferase
MSADLLASLIDDPRLRLCDVRWYLGAPGRGEEEYRSGHIPGATFVDLETMLCARRGPGRHPLPTPIRFAATLGRLGISPDHAVVAYDSSGGAIAARLWWMLGQLGHRDFAVLDGGVQAWVGAGHALTTEIRPIQPIAYNVLMSGWPGAVTLDQVAGDRHAVIVDARAPERYRGEVEPVDARPGHIPGAVNLPHAGNLGPDGRHLPIADLAQRFAGLGDGPIMYCGSGVTACANLLAMEAAGIAGGRLYDGSWSDWASHPELPAETAQ